MKVSGLKADQLNTWSEIYAPRITPTAPFCLAKAPPTAVAAAAPAASFATRLTHRALQTLRQARMQVCPRSRPWPQVLPLGELPRPAAANGLRTAGLSRADRPVSRPSSSGPRDLGRDMRDQSRTAASPRGDLRDRDAQPTFLLTIRSAGHANGGSVARQYAGRLAEERLRNLVHCGDLR